MPEPDWAPAATLAVAKRRAAMLCRARAFFEARGLLEVETPVLSRAAVSDPHIDSVRAALDLRPGTDYYLRTSPEFAMKRLLCAGFPDVFEIARVFRDREAGRRHQPEFTLVEWYRLGFGLEEMMQETVSFLGELLDDETPPASFRAYRDAFETATGVDPLTAGLDALRRAANADRRLADAVGTERDDWLDLLLATRVAPTFDRDTLTVLYHYPASQAALAKIVTGEPAVAERFEVFRGSLELANGFVELTDPAEQSARFDRDQATRARHGRPCRPIDRQFLAALESGLPACAGVAVGFDRLVMINEKTDDIRNVVAFSFD